MEKNESNIIISKNGPYIVSNLPLKVEEVVFDKENFPIRYKTTKKFPQKNYRLCRCGNSKSKPFCDGSHLAGFDGEETANPDKGTIIKGNNLLLRDITSLCAGTGFCDRAAGTWQLVKDKNKKSNAMAIQQACNCPSGRLTIIKDGKGKKGKEEIEPTFKPSISLIEETGLGPIWAKGGIKIISSSGKKYEIRNRVTLCRCGKSNNKPFCDGSHFD